MQQIPVPATTNGFKLSSSLISSSTSSPSSSDLFNKDTLPYSSPSSSSTWSAANERNVTKRVVLSSNNGSLVSVGTKMILSSSSLTRGDDSVSVMPTLPPGSPTLNEVFNHYQTSAALKRRVSLPATNGKANVKAEYSPEESSEESNKEPKAKKSAAATPKTASHVEKAPAKKESSSEESSDSDEDEPKKDATPAKKPAAVTPAKGTPKAPSKKESASDSESGSEDKAPKKDTPAKPAFATTKPAAAKPAAAKKEESSPEESDSTDEEATKKPAAKPAAATPAKPAARATPAKKQESSSSEESSSEDEAAKNPAAKLAATISKALPVKAPAKKQESDSSEDETPATKKPVVTFNPAPVKRKKEESSSEESSSDEEDEAPKKKGVAIPPPAKKPETAVNGVANRKKESSSEESSSEEDEEASKKSPVKAAPAPAKAKKDEDSSEEESEDEEDEPKKAAPTPPSPVKFVKGNMDEINEGNGNGDDSFNNRSGFAGRTRGSRGIRGSRGGRNGFGDRGGFRSGLGGPQAQRSRSVPLPLDPAALEENKSIEKMWDDYGIKHYTSDGKWWCRECPEDKDGFNSNQAIKQHFWAAHLPHKRCEFIGCMKRLSNADSFKAHKDRHLERLGLLEKRRAPQSKQTKTKETHVPERKGRRNEPEVSEQPETARAEEQEVSAPTRRGQRERKVQPLSGIRKKSLVKPLSPAKEAKVAEPESKTTTSKSRPKTGAMAAEVDHDEDDSEKETEKAEEAKSRRGKKIQKGKAVANPESEHDDVEEPTGRSKRRKARGKKDSDESSQERPSHVSSLSSGSEGRTLRRKAVEVVTLDEDNGRKMSPPAIAESDSQESSDENKERNKESSDPKEDDVSEAETIPINRTPLIRSIAFSALRSAPRRGRRSRLPETKQKKTEHGVSPKPTHSTRYNRRQQKSVQEGLEWFKENVDLLRATFPHLFARLEVSGKTQPKKTTKANWKKGAGKAGKGEKHGNAAGDPGATIVVENSSSAGKVKDSAKDAKAKKVVTGKAGDKEAGKVVGVKQNGKSASVEKKPNKKKEEEATSGAEGTKAEVKSAKSDHVANGYAEPTTAEVEDKSKKATKSKKETKKEKKTAKAVGNGDAKKAAKTTSKDINAESEPVTPEKGAPENSKKGKQAASKRKYDCYSGTGGDAGDVDADRDGPTKAKQRAIDSGSEKAAEFQETSEEVKPKSTKDAKSKTTKKPDTKSGKAATTVDEAGRRLDSIYAAWLEKNENAIKRKNRGLPLEELTEKTLEAFTAFLVNI